MANEITRQVDRYDGVSERPCGTVSMGCQFTAYGNNIYLNQTWHQL